MTKDQLQAECSRLGFCPVLTKFNISDVPENLRRFAPYAEVWGHNSEDVRDDVVQATPSSLRRHVHRLIWNPEIQALFNQWLAGPEIDSPTLTDAYLAFTCLRMSADELGD